MILPKPGLELGTIEVKGQRSHRYATHATLFLVKSKVKSRY